MDLYIGNASAQIIAFNYRLPGSASLRTQMIPVGQQVRISGSLLPAEIDAIIDQHRQYGLVPHDEVERARSNFGGMVYSVGKPIPANRIGYAREVQLDRLIEQGKENRKQAALAVNDTIEKNLTGNDKVRVLEMEVDEEERSLAPGEESSEKISEGVRVSRSPDVPSPAHRGRGRPRKIVQ